MDTWIVAPSTWASCMLEMAASASASWSYRMYAVPRFVLTAFLCVSAAINHLHNKELTGSVDGEVEILDATKFAKYLVQVVLVDCLCQTLHDNLQHPKVSTCVLSGLPGGESGG